MTYSLTEPQPLPQLQGQGKQGAYIRIGRGGAGNWVKPTTFSQAPPPTKQSPSKAQQPPPTTTPSLPKPTSPLSSSPAKYTSGRGGIGNAHTGERPMFFFDEELERIYSREGRTPPVYHIGRAGFGNRVGTFSSASSAAGGAGGDFVEHERVMRAEEDRTSEDSRRSWASGSSDGRRSRSSADQDHHGVWGRLSHTFSRGS